MKLHQVVVLGLALTGLPAADNVTPLDDEQEKSSSRPSLSVVRTVLVVGFTEALRSELASQLRSAGFEAWEAAEVGEAVGFCSLVARSHWPCEHVDLLVIDRSCCQGRQAWPAGPVAHHLPAGRGCAAFAVLAGAPRAPVDAQPSSRQVVATVRAIAAGLLTAA